MVLIVGVTVASATDTSQNDTTVTTSQKGQSTNTMANQINPTNISTTDNYVSNIKTIKETNNKTNTKTLKKRCKQHNKH